MCGGSPVFTGHLCSGCSFGQDNVDIFVMRCREVSCYHPRIMVPTGKFHKKSGKPIYEFVKDPDNRTYLEASENGLVIVPCGRCLGCRLDYSRSWADRMALELETSLKAIFITLTYNNDNVPILSDSETGEVVGYTLVKEDVQLFMKRLRRSYDGHDGADPVRIRFYLSGEYGSADYTQRPHYHAIIFGLGLEDFPLREYRCKNELGQDFYRLPEIEEVWPYGFVLGSGVSWNTFAYVARYVMKKVKDDSSDAIERGVQPEFSLMSRRPGIGALYLEKNPDCLNCQSIFVSTESGSRKIYIPQYFLNRLSLTDPERYDKIKQERRRSVSDSVLLKLQKTTLRYLEQLEVDEQRKARSLEALPRYLCE